MILTGHEIIEAMKAEYIKEALPQCVEANSLDVRLQDKILMEVPANKLHLSDPYDSSLQHYSMHTIPKGGKILRPGTFLLGATIEILNLPDTICGDFMLKSTLARMGLEHAKAGWIDAGFSGTITLELKVQTQYHQFKIYPGMLIGQIVFYRTSPVGQYSYRTKGRYNGQQGPQLGRGLRKV